jgi:hypothetical protein
MQRRFTFFKKTLFALIPTLLLLGLAELSFRHIDPQIDGSPVRLIDLNNSAFYREGERKIIFARPLSESDDALGFKCVPGRHTIQVDYRSTLLKKRLQFAATIGEDGYRTTGNSSNRENPEIWIMGCSSTWGWLVEDEETYPWLVQQEMPKYHVRNLGISGYGNVHALIQIELVEKQNSRIPEIAVFAYNEFHLPRNVAAPSWIRASRSASENSGIVQSYPRAQFSGEEGLKITMVKIEEMEKEDPPKGVMLQATKAVFDRIKVLCDRMGITPILAFQTGGKNDPVVLHCRKAGFSIVDISVLASDECTFAPIDYHPNALAHSLYAKKLLSHIRKLNDRP